MQSWPDWQAADLAIWQRSLWALALVLLDVTGRSGFVVALAINHARFLGRLQSHQSRRVHCWWPKSPPILLTSRFGAQILNPPDRNLKPLRARVLKFSTKPKIWAKQVAQVNVAATTSCWCWCCRRCCCRCRFCCFDCKCRLNICSRIEQLWTLPSCVFRPQRSQRNAQTTCSFGQPG